MIITFWIFVLFLFLFMVSHGFKESPDEWDNLSWVASLWITIVVMSVIALLFL